LTDYRLENSVIILVMEEAKGSFPSLILLI